MNARLSDEDIEDIISRSVASLRMEGMECTPEEIEMERKRMRGEITDDEYKKWVLERAGVVVDSTMEQGYHL